MGGEEREPSQVMSRCYEDVGARRSRVNYVNHVRQLWQGSAGVGTPAPLSGVFLASCALLSACYLSIHGRV